MRISIRTIMGSSAVSKPWMRILARLGKEGVSEWMLVHELSGWDNSRQEIGHSVLAELNSSLEIFSSAARSWSTVAGEKWENREAVDQKFMHTPLYDRQYSRMWSRHLACSPLSIWGSDGSGWWFQGWAAVAWDTPLNLVVTFVS